jgi:hypothetical protein
MEKHHFVDMVNYNGENLTEKNYNNRLRSYHKFIGIMLVANLLVWSALLFFLM